MRRSAATFALALCVWSSSATGAESIRQPLVTPQNAWEKQLLDDAVQGNLRSLSPLRAALVASGVDRAESLANYEQRLQAIASQLPRDAATHRERASVALHALHRNLLTGGFDADCDSVAATLDSGRYNCVTASLLFLELARQMELPCSVLHAPGHVRIRIDDRAPFEIEPTCAGCFAEGKLLAWTSPPRCISQSALVGKLYYNRGIEALERRDFTAAINAFDRSLWLDAEDVQAQQNLLAALNNGALSLTDQREYVAAKALLDKAASLDPRYPPLANNELHLHGRWIITLCERSEHATAIELLSDLSHRYPQAELSRNGRAAVYRLWVAELIHRGETNAALARAEEGLALSPHDAQLQQQKAQLQKGRS